MAGKKKSNVGEVAEQLEHAFMAGLGALSDAQKKGAEHFESLLVDGDLANNRLNWQWVAGTGADRPAVPAGVWY